MGLSYFDKYYNILGIPPGSSDVDIKKAYRRLAKRYHPDKSGTSDTRALFIQVNQAYEILLNRHVYIREAVQRAKRNSERKSNVDPAYREGQNTRARAESYADMKFKAFERTPLYKTAVVVNSASNYVFLFLGGLMVIGPIFTYYNEKDIPTVTGKPYEFQILPICIGLAFIFGIWYFLFYNRDED
jgi:hypothetical protein